jgi:uncharacterized membrane protein
MPAKRARPERRLPYPLRLIRGRPRLFLALAVGIACILVLPAKWPLEVRFCIAWDVAIATYLVLLSHLVMTTPAHRIPGRASQEDEGRVGILVLTAAAAFFSLAAIFFVLGSQGTRDPLLVGLLIATIVLSWVFTHTIFALHYAHEFYDEDNGSGLAFPGAEAPDYWDFVYFSFVIGMTSQVSDVAISARNIRRTATAHGVVSFLFNAALVALTVNIAASAV